QIGHEFESIRSQIFGSLANIFYLQSAKMHKRIIPTSRGPSITLALQLSFCSIM
ncbi:unnamed protein product, partial [Brassica rapa]